MLNDADIQKYTKKGYAEGYILIQSQSGPGPTMIHTKSKLKRERVVPLLHKLI